MSETDKTTFRVYPKETTDRVVQFYKANHENQTYDFVVKEKQKVSIL